MPEQLSDEDILLRLKAAESWSKKFGDIDRDLSSKFRDPDSNGLYAEDEDDEDGGDLLDDAPIGVTNQFQINTYTKLAAITISDPDWFVKARENSAVEPTRQWMRRQWREKGWRRPCSRTFLKRSISGLGILAYRWDKEQRTTILEQVNSWDIFIDPGTSDFMNLPYAFRRVRRTLSQAIKQFDPEGKGIFSEYEGENVNSYSKKIDILVYWDRNEEAVLMRGKVLKRSENHYGEVPLIFDEGDPDPGPSIWPIGDGQQAAAAQAELGTLTKQISNIAQHGGPMTAIVSKMLTKPVLRAMQDMNENGFIEVKDIPERAILRIPGEELTPATLEAKREAQRTLGSIQGVTGGMLGVPDESIRFATQEASIAGNAGARNVQSRTEYETFLDRVAERVARCEVLFGGPEMGADGKMGGDPEKIELWWSLQQVEEIRAIEGSTVYRDPAQDQQQAMQLQQLVAQMAPLLVGLGIPPSMALHLILQLLQDTLRAFGRHNMDQYLPGLQPFLQALDQGQVQPPNQGQDQGKSPKELINYKDAPEDIKRQMEAEAGMQPSQMGSPPAPGGDTPESKMAELDAKGRTEILSKAADHAHELHKLQMEHDHQARMKTAELQSQALMAAHQATQQANLSAQNNAAKRDQVKMTTDARAKQTAATTAHSTAAKTASRPTTKRAVRKRRS